jgi:histidinol-phosphate/aromatic aminotransferase/cobyric acid decarboxylase-like protein
LVRPASDPKELSDALLHVGVIVRPMGAFIRVTIGTADENRRFLESMDNL